MGKNSLIMDTKQAYNQWASGYDTNPNRTRDLESKALRMSLAYISFDRCLEIGCGTGKNTGWLASKAKQVTAVDFSEAMLAKAREKIVSDRVQFIRADIKESWTFTGGLYDLVGFSLVLEHIDDLDHVFCEAGRLLHPGGYVYLGELHPFKQYLGTRARFDTPEGRLEPECFTHHISDFTTAAKENGMELTGIQEYFDDKMPVVPRILTLLWKKRLSG